MKKVRSAIIVTHFLTNSIIQLSTIGIMFRPYGPSTKDALLLTLSGALVMIDVLLPIFRYGRIHNSLPDSDLVHVQFIDWPLMILSFLFVFFIWKSEQKDIVFTLVIILELLIVPERIIVLRCILRNRLSQFDIDEIMNMLNCNQPEAIQTKGIVQAKSISAFYLFILPAETPDVWENCSRIVSEKTDRELKPYLKSLLQWALTIDVPGSETIYQRLLCYQKDEEFEKELTKQLEESNTASNQERTKRIMSLGKY